jgi:uncharacterized membrane protein
MEELFNRIGSLICHQLPSRTLSAGGRLLPVCARDMGIYTGIFVSALFLMALRRLRAQKPPGIALAVAMCALMLPMVFDGVLSYTGIIETNNTARLFTGLLFGLPIPFLLVPAAHYSVYGQNERPVLRSILELPVVYAIGSILCFMLLKSMVPYDLACLIYVFGFAFLLSRITYTILARMRRVKRNTLYVMTVAGTLCVLTFLYLLSAYVLQPLKVILLTG